MDPGFRAAPPRIGPSTIARARIVDLLDERWDRAVISIVAGAGFGKSTLLAQAMASNAAEPRGQDVWLSLRPADNDASTLLAGLFQALDGEVPVDSELTVDSLTQQLWTRAPTHVALVLDDVHVLDPGSTGAAALAELLDAIPTNAHLVVASRRQPDLHLARLLAHDKVIELGEDHLRFTPSEQARLAARHGGGDGEGDLGGWAALLTLNQRFGLSRAADFAVEEVVSHLDEAERSYLLMAALLDGASPEQLVAIGSETGITPPDALDSTDHYHRLSNLPLVNAEPDGSIRPHHLWLDIFATTTDAEALGSTRRACADVLLRDGEPARAWELLAGAGDIETGLPALYDAINDQSNPPRVDQLERWRSAIPTTLTERAEVRYLEAIRLREVRPWSLDVDVEMTAAIEAFEQAGDIARQLGSAVRATFSIWLTCNQVRLADMGRIAEQFVDIVPGLKAIRIMNGVAQADVTGEGQRALELLTDISADDFEPRLAFFVPLYRLSAHLNTGRPDLAATSIPELLACAAECDGAGGTLVSAAAEPITRFVGGELDIDTARFDRIGRYNVGEQLEVEAWLGIIAVHQGRIDDAIRHLAIVDEPRRPGIELPRFASARAVLSATLAIETDGRHGSTDELQTIVDNHHRIGAEWRAVAWQPAVPCLLFPEVIDRLAEAAPAFAEHPGVLLAAAIHRSRSGEAYRTSAMPIDYPPAVFCALPLRPAIELACAAVAADDDRGNALVEYAVGRWPVRTRDVLRDRAEVDPKHRSAKAAAALLRAVPIPPIEEVRIATLGPPRLFHGSDECDTKDWRRDRVRQMLLHLVRQRRITRDRLASVLWPDLDEERATSNLRLTLFYLHGVLEPNRSSGDAPYFIRQRDGVLKLEGTDRLVVDAWRFDELEELAERALRLGAAGEAIVHLTDLVGLWRGDYLTGLDDTPEVDLDRADRRQRFVRHGVRLAELLLGSGRAAEATTFARRALDVEPWSEAAYRVLAAALDDMGDRSAALRTIETCHTMLGTLDVDPTPETVMLERRIRRGKRTVNPDTG